MVGPALPARSGPPRGERYDTTSRPVPRGVGRAIAAVPRGAQRGAAVRRASRRRRASDIGASIGGEGAAAVFAPLPGGPRRRGGAPPGRRDRGFRPGTPTTGARCGSGPGPCARGSARRAGRGGGAARGPGASGAGAPPVRGSRVPRTRRWGRGKGCKRCSTAVRGAGPSAAIPGTTRRCPLRRTGCRRSRAARPRPGGRPRRRGCGGSVGTAARSGGAGVAVRVLARAAYAASPFPSSVMRAIMGPARKRRKTVREA